MSFLVEKEVVCTLCEFPNQAELWSIVNVKSDPELRDILLGGELNMVECKSCRKIFYAEHFLLYHDPDSELMAFVYPLPYGQEKERWETKTRDDFAKSETPVSYLPLTMFGLDALVRLVEWDEEVKVQGEIVETLAREHGFAIKKLKPALARKNEFPIVLPMNEAANVSFREALLEGLERLLGINEHLYVYAQLQKRLAENPALVFSL